MTFKIQLGACALLLCFSILVNSCAGSAPSFEVVVDTIGSDGGIAPRTFVLVPTMQDVKESDLRFKEFAKQIEVALAKRQYLRVRDIEDADLVIFVTYGVGDPQQHSYSYSIPMWGQTGVASSSTTGNVYVFGNSASYSANTTYTPTYGVVGSNSYQGTYVTYFRYLKLDAFDLKELRNENLENQLWSATVTSTGSSDDLRLVFPYMMAGCQKYLGDNTGRKLMLSLDANALSVQEYRGGK